MTRETSIKAFRMIRDQGLLSKVRFQVYESLVECTELGELVSAGELFYRMKNRGRNPSHSNVSTRLGELREMGLAEEVGRKGCSLTGMTVIAWRAVDALPKTLKKARTRRTVYLQFDLFGEIRKSSIQPFHGGIAFIERK